MTKNCKHLTKSGNCHRMSVKGCWMKCPFPLHQQLCCEYQPKKKRETTLPQSIKQLARTQAYRGWGKPVWHTVHEVEDSLIAFAEQLMELPLAERLTEAERAAIRQMHADTFPDDIDRSLDSIRVGNTLERIFGKELFKPAHK